MWQTAFLPTRWLAFGLVVSLALLAESVADEARYRSHPPIRPLPRPSDRALPEGRVLFVDAKTGDDSAAGSQAKPWKTVGHAVTKLQSGDTLCLRGGTYYEHVTAKLTGTAAKPIAIRAYPGELAVIDGGLREFFEQSATAWEPFADGAAGEFRSAKSYPDLGGQPEVTNLLGLFGDSLVPLHGYRLWTDFRTSNEYFSKLEAGKVEAGAGVYCGPGLMYDTKTGRIHVRLAHTTQKALGDNNYRGETDPRKLPLVVAGYRGGSPLRLDGCRYVRVQDLVVRGAREPAIAVEDSANIEFDGVTAYGGKSAMQVRDTAGLRLWNCALRGIAAPWTFRGSLKYRAIEARIFSASGWQPTGNDNRDFELAYSEFTDCVDGVFIGNVRNVQFHHNLLDNLSDDGIFLTATTGYDGTTPGGNVQIHQNVLSRCLTTFAFGIGNGRQKLTAAGRQTGAGVFIYRNVFDFRRPVHYQQPEEGQGEFTTWGRTAGDHGGPAWEPMTIYHNTVVSYDPPFRAAYATPLGSHLVDGFRRELFNNVFVQVEGTPGNVLPEVVVATAIDKAKPADPLDDLIEGEKEKAPPKKAAPSRLPILFQTDGNLHWSYAIPVSADSLLGEFRSSPAFALSKKLYPPGWTSHDIAADPQFTRFAGDWREPLDLSLRKNSPAIDAGIKVPEEWPDPLREADAGEPDLGALPAAAVPWRVGVQGRLTAFGSPVAAASPILVPNTFLLPDDELPPAVKHRPAMIVQGYPAFDAPLLEFALRRQRVPVENLERTWLPTDEYAKYSLVAITGDLARAEMKPRQYIAADLQRVRQFLEGGGTLLLMRGTVDVFATPEGRKFLTDLTGAGTKTGGAMKLLLPEHPFAKHLDPMQPHPWLESTSVAPVNTGRGEVILGNAAGATILYRLPVGKGQLVYVGWELADSIPNGRERSTVEAERVFEEQVQVLTEIVNSAYLPSK